MVLFTEQQLNNIKKRLIMSGDRAAGIVLWVSIIVYVFLLCVFPIPYFDKAKAEDCTCFGSFGGPWQPAPGWGKPNDGNTAISPAPPC